MAEKYRTRGEEKRYWVDAVGLGFASERAISSRSSKNYFPINLLFSFKVYNAIPTCRAVLWKLSIRHSTVPLSGDTIPCECFDLPCAAMHETMGSTGGGLSVGTAFGGGGKHLITVAFPLPLLNSIDSRLERQDGRAVMFL
jgi:hypothetical protein